MNRRLALIAYLAAIAFSVCAFAQEQPPVPPQRVAPPSATASADELVDRADVLHAQKQYLDAIDYYRAAIKKDNAAATWNKLGITYLQTNDLQQAHKCFDKSSKLDKTYPDAKNNLGVIYYMRKKYSKAIKYYKQAIALRDGAASFHSNLGTAYFSKKEISRAMAEYQRALQLDPAVFDHQSAAGVAAQLSSPEDRAHYSYVLAKMYAQSGNFDRSLNYLRKAMEDGYKGIDDVYKDQEFAGLRKDPRFNELMVSKPVAIPQ